MSREKAVPLAEALEAASDTKQLVIGENVLEQVPPVFAEQFGAASALLVADTNTFRAAGQRVLAAFHSAGVDMPLPFVFDAAGLYAEQTFVDQLELALREAPRIPVVVGSGSLNDITKLAAHKAGRSYMVVATAASMDGYTAFGASITSNGAKQTFMCPAPRAAVADLEVVRNAPDGMNSSGYADLLAKIPAGADWIVSDALGIEPIDDLAWGMVQVPLRGWLASPEGVRQRRAEPTAYLLNGLMMGGFAMQHCKSSRPASGAEHQFSHLWDMQHLTVEGQSPSHGFKVGIGSLASIRLYECLLDLLPAGLDIPRALDNWPSMDEWEVQIRETLGDGEVAEKAVYETRAKYLTRSELRGQLECLRGRWPEISAALRQHLPRSTEVRSMLEAAGAPADSLQIGVPYQRLRDSHMQACFIRRRFTVLDVAVRTGLLEQCLDRLYPMTRSSHRQENPA